MTETRNGRFLVDPQDMGVGRALVQAGEYGTHEIATIRKLTSETSRVLVVGSHVGALAIPVSRTVRHVTAIEANPKTYRLLLANVLLNDVKNIRPIKIAASDSKTPIQFVMNKVNSGGSKRMPVRKLREYFYDNPDVVTLDADRLDDVLDDDFDVVVMDLEGSEYFALKGMRRILAGARHLIVEFLPHHISSVAGVSVDSFVAEIEPHFDELFIPSLNTRVGKGSLLSQLHKMFDAGASDDGIVFSKLEIPVNRHGATQPGREADD
jgi:FkbM family methyltransferase